ncbi:FG-GAP repeat protein,intergrin alpha chain [Trypanosoma cruzi cruzi]|nr:putative intergrin alpha chain protein [Trypanosoma cruzi]PBJ77377.1 FG-GAP repeat protein,intergrin alpha chain [Trypanosoma cruzi cruzi]PBJ77378.1 FG-GAP repeat protein,intergrin alpha chain [Trypanosoma cruzi cruzi]PWU83324.1 putative FG-GAP repeat protein [Trypanosoma cruzi]
MKHCISHLGTKVFASRGCAAAGMAIKATIVFVLMMAVAVGADPVKWAEPLFKKPLLRKLLPEEVMAPETVPSGPLSNESNTCRSGVYLEWTARVGSSVFATPRIVDLNHDGNKEILVPTYTQYFEALDGVNGEDEIGFPFVHPNFKSYCSPIPVDMDGDGKTEWLVAMYTGELMVFGDDGKARGAIQVPALPIKKNWMKRNLTGEEAVNLKLQPVRPSAEYFDRILRARQMVDMTPRFPKMRQKTGDGNHGDAAAALGESRPPTAMPRRHLADVDLEEEESNEQGEERHDVGTMPRAEGEEREMDLFFDEDEEDFNDEEALLESMEKQHGIGAEGWLSAEAKASMEMLYHPELYKSSVNYEGEKDAFNFRNIRNPTTVVVAEDEVAVDPHIMSTPVIVDADGDGDLDIVLHLSYFFDMKAYEGEKAELLPSDIDINDYVADVLMVLNLVTGEMKWMKVLHLSKKNDTIPAYALSSPVIANPDEDYQQDIYVTTTAGAIFGFNGHGKQLRGWPVWMSSSITSSPSMEDVNADGLIDVCAGDTEGNVACFTANGKQLWSKTFSGAVTKQITYGDVDGDGSIDLAFGTTSGLLYAVRGRDGALLPHFPIATEGPILAPPLLVNLNNTQPLAQKETEGLHIIVPSHDGVLYIVSGTTGCVDGIDINEKSSTMVLADDMTGNGKLDLVVSTLSGSVMVFETQAAFHPLKAWISRVKSTNGLTASEGYVGVFIHPSSRVPRDIRGEQFVLLVTIYDQRRGDAIKRRYGLTITIGPRILVHHMVYGAPGTYAITLRTPLERMYASLFVVMLLPNGQRYEDSVALSFNMHFLESIKIVFLVPFLLACLAISFVRKQHEVQPPPFETQLY